MAEQLKDSFTKEEVEAIIKKYTLNEKEYNRILKTVIQVMSSDKVVSDRPLAIIVGGQQGSGKTALINYTSTISSKREFVIIDNDFFRAFHPNAAEIKKYYPGLYTVITDQIGMGFTPHVISYFMGNDVQLTNGDVIKNDKHTKYDLILHQTLKNNRIADDAMAKLRDLGYTVGVRAFAVPYFESKMSQMERCKEQFEKMGFCRHIPPEGHFDSLRGLPKTVDYIEKNNKSNFIEIFTRSDDIRHPRLVYATFNPETRDETLKTLSDCEKVSHDDQPFGFENAHDAVIKTWAQEAKRCAKTLPSRIEALKAEGGEDVPGLSEHIKELEENFEIYQKDNNIIPPQESQE